jgi:transcriptional regulator with GAF, ATPase, and Fis domain
MSNQAADSLLQTGEDADILDQVHAENGGLSGFELYYPKISLNPEIRNVYSLIKKIAQSNASVLIHGETGTGKELIARSIWSLSLRHEKPFVAVNCAALHEQLLESELFGHEKGAFTGAIQRHTGKFEQADAGTLFLDEIGDMHASTQAKILRVLQEQSFTRVGGNKDLLVDVRVIAATNKDLWEEMEKGNFRADLYYRLNVVSIHLPPLRERQEDIPLLVEYFRRKFSAEIKKEVGPFNDEALNVLIRHSWPGNIRELRNIVERAVLIAGEGHKIGAGALSMSGKDYFAAGGRERRSQEREGTSFRTLNLQELEREAIIAALRRTKWVQKEAADLLGISPRALNYKIAQHNITHDGWRKHS